jgi:polysaccharide deacetylase family protein (PEP-CTERM system associated)
MTELPDAAAEGPRQHVLTIGMEDYFHVGAFNTLIQRGQWYRFESRLEQGVRRTLDLLDECNATATFFVLGWVADNNPELVNEVADRGHEVASKGYYHRSIRDMSPSEFREDLARSREAIEKATRRRVLGYRMANGWLQSQDLWALDVLAEEGYEFDSSIAPILRRYADEPWRRFAHRHEFGSRTLWEFPISTSAVFGWQLPLGGNYLRQLPPMLTQRAVAHWDRTQTAPLVMYFHTWEMDAEQPKISAASVVAHVRQYRHLSRMPQLVQHYLRRYRFTGVADYLGLCTALSEEQKVEVSNAAGAARAIRMTTPAGAGPAVERFTGLIRAQVTVVVPCYNEELILPYLSNTLRRMQERFRTDYDLRFILIDDCSTDGTLAALHQVFGDDPSCTILHNWQNAGVAGTILNGIRAASTDIVCSIDCDCTYDPHELARMIPLLADDVDMVTASPYHPQGHVHNVPQWRLAMSRTLSAMYRLVLHSKLYTYTSCFRVYRRAALLNVRIEERGFLGVTEMLGKLDLAGSKIVEFPTTLEVRMLGRSKMKIVNTIFGQLRLVARFAIARLFGPKPAARPPRVDAGIVTPTSTTGALMSIVALLPDLIA